MIITNTNKELFDMGQIQIKFTEAELKNLKLKKHSYFAYDIKSHGLAIRVYPSGVKTFYYVYTPKNNSSTQQISLGKFGKLTITEARAKAKEYLKVTNTSDDPFALKQKRKTEHTISSLVREYSEEVLENRAKKTRSTIMSCFNAWLLNKSTDNKINKFIDYSIRDKFISKAKKEDMNKIFKIVSKRGMYAANKFIVYTKTLFNYAIDKNYITVNPCKGIELHEEYETNDYLSKDQYWRVINMCFVKNLKENKLKISHYTTLGLNVVACTVIAWALITGRRQYSEGASIKWSDINWDTKTLKLAQTKTEKNAYIRIPKLGMDLLKMIQNSRMEAMYNYGDERREYVFPSNVKVGPIVNVRKTWEKVLELCGINYIAFKQCRHSFATNFLSSSKNIVSVQKALRHTTAKTTMKYAKLIDEDLDRDYDNFQSPDTQFTPEVLKFPKAE